MDDQKPKGDPFLAFGTANPIDDLLSRFSAEDCDRSLNGVFSGQNIVTLRREAQQFNLGLVKRAKPRTELIVSVDCLVESVVGYTQPVFITPNSEMVSEGSLPSYESGHRSYLEISVTTDSACPIKKLKSAGLPPIQSGDRIVAYILKGEEIREAETVMENVPNSIPHAGSAVSQEGKSHWVERDFKQEETTQKIEKLFAGRVVATYITKDPSIRS